MLKFFLLLLSLTALSFAEDSIESQTIEKEFLIAKSTTDYKEAKNYAQKIAKKLNIKLDLRDLSFHKKDFLSLPKDICQEEFEEDSCYMPRGRYDDGEYISIEHSNYYSAFTDGYYIVMVASGEDVSKNLKKVKKEVADAYVKKAEVYMGCVH